MSIISAQPPGDLGAGLVRYAPLNRHEEFQSAAALYARVFRYDRAQYSVNPHLLSSLVRNGGSAVGAWRGEELVGFAYGFAGCDHDGRAYHYSQATVVADGLQGTGVGRELKAHQRDIAQKHGQQEMRWTFDPTLLRNAHFTFDVLGARGIDYVRDFYDEPHTDRILVSWQLDIPAAKIRHQPPALLREAELGSVIDDAQPCGARWAILPEVPKSQDEVRAVLRPLCTEGRALISCQRIGDGRTALLSVPVTEERTA